MIIYTVAVAFFLFHASTLIRYTFAGKTVIGVRKNRLDIVTKDEEDVTCIDDRETHLSTGMTSSVSLQSDLESDDGSSNHVTDDVDRIDAIDNGVVRHINRDLTVDNRDDINEQTGQGMIFCYSLSL